MTNYEIPYLSSELAIEARRRSDEITARQKAAKRERMRAIEAHQELKEAEALL